MCVCVCVCVCVCYIKRLEKMLMCINFLSCFSWNDKRIYLLENDRPHGLPKRGYFRSSEGQKNQQPCEKVLPKLKDEI